MDILKSLTWTLLFGTIVGFAISYTLSLDLTRTIVGTILAQFIFFMLYNNYMARRAESQIESEMTVRIQEYTKQGADLECAYCRTSNYVPIRMDEDNTFVCDDCGKPNAVYVSITTAQKTQSIDMLPLTVNTLIQEELEAKEKIANG